MPNTRISDLTAATSVAGTDVYPSVQTAGVGPVKTSLTQITAFALANAPAGAVATPSIAPTGDTNTGFWFPAADTIAASTGGSERMRITSAGNVGIGTTSPNPLGFGNVLTVSDGGSPALSLMIGGASIFDAVATTTASFITTRTSTPLVFQTNGSERMRITSTGNVGIRTTSPSVALEVNASAVQMVLQYGGLTTQRSFVSSNAGFSASYNGLIFGSNSTDRGTQTHTGLSSWYQELGSYALSGDAWKVLYQAAGAGSVSEYMRITSAGNVLIGTTSSPTTGTQCLTIETETAPTATPADTVTFYSSDLSAGNTMPSFYTEGTIVGTGTPTANRTIAVRINGTVYYLLASTIP